MKKPLQVKDEIGIIEITYDDMLRYHGKDFAGGVALAYKFLELAFKELLGNEIPERKRIRLVLGFNPPGVVDGLEFATRALTQNRTIIDSNIGLGPPSVFGSYYFEMQYDKKKIVACLKDGLLPEEFLELAAKGLAKTATEKEMQLWKHYKSEIGKAIIQKTPNDVFDIIETQK